MSLLLSKDMIHAVGNFTSRNSHVRTLCGLVIINSDYLLHQAGIRHRPDNPTKDEKAAWNDDDDLIVAAGGEWVICLCPKCYVAGSAAFRREHESRPKRTGFWTAYLRMSL